MAALHVDRLDPKPLLVSTRLSETVLLCCVAGTRGTLRIFSLNKPRLRVLDLDLRRYQFDARMTDCNTPYDMIQ